LIVETIQRLRDIETDVQRLCNDEVVMGLFVVNTRRAKESLIQRAVETRHAILAKCLEIVVQNVQRITQAYTEMHARTTTLPKDENQLMELKVFVEEKDLILSKLGFDVKMVDKYINFLTFSYFTFDLKLLEDYFSLM
jgi:hypothetical protein